MEYTITFEDVTQSAPWWVCRSFKNNRLPEDVFYHVSLSFPVSPQALCNPDFDWRRFVLTKIYNTLRRLRDQHRAKFLTLYESGFYAKTGSEISATIFKFHFCYTTI